MHRVILPKWISEEFKRAAAPDGTSLKPLERTLFVGALLQGGHDTSVPLLSATDNIYLTRLVELLPNYGYGLNKQSQIDVCNLVYGDDFLKAQAKADMVVLCYVFHHPTIASNDKDGLLFQQSDRALLPDAWFNAVAQSGAKIVVNIRDLQDNHNTEVPTQFLDKAPYRLQPSTRRHHQEMRGFTIRYDVLICGMS